MSVRHVIADHMRQVAQEQRIKLAPLTDDLVLFDSGLSSLGLAILAVRLEEALGIDPFAASGDAPITFGELASTIESASMALQPSA